MIANNPATQQLAMKDFTMLNAPNSKATLRSYSTIIELSRRAADDVNPFAIPPASPYAIGYDSSSR
jgi:hypothetical protein